jgi:hypothetical protein
MWAAQIRRPTLKMTTELRAVAFLSSVAIRRRWASQYVRAKVALHRAELFVAPSASHCWRAPPAVPRPSVSRSDHLPLLVTQCSVMNEIANDQQQSAVTSVGQMLAKAIALSIKYDGLVPTVRCRTLHRSIPLFRRPRQAAVEVPKHHSYRCVFGLIVMICAYPALPARSSQAQPIRTFWVVTAHRSCAPSGSVELRQVPAIQLKFATEHGSALAADGQATT